LWRDRHFSAVHLWIVSIGAQRKADRQTNNQTERSTDDLMEEWTGGKVDKKTDGQTKHEQTQMERCIYGQTKIYLK